jgi:type 2 lantibiotic biosynthesis protein LanM
MTIESSPQPVPDTQRILNNPLWYRALTLQERLELLRAQGNEPAPFNADLAEHRLQSWKAQRPFDEEAFFAERLALDGLTEDEFYSLSGTFCEARQWDTSELPDWLQELALAFDVPVSTELAQVFSPSGSPARNSGAPGARFFLVAILPLINRGVERLKAEVVALLNRYPDPPFDPTTVHRMFFVPLFGQLTQQVSRTLTLELHVARLEGRLTGETPEERFQNFVRQLSHKERIIPFLEEYAALTRILIETIDHWVCFSGEILRHLCADWQEICQLFSPEGDPGKLLKIWGGAGDAHKRGRSTLRMRFASGLQLMYKPRSLAVDMHFQQLLIWLNEHGNHPPFRTLRILDKGSYGWSEFVAAHDCASEEEVARFYERQGGYLAVLYALNATDLHHENLIAAGEHPVIIDLEALLHPRITPAGSLPIYQTSREVIRNSVLSIGLLPERSWGTREHPGVDISGLGGADGQFIPTPVLQVNASGTDDMRFIRQHLRLSEENNRPVIGGESIAAFDYKEQFMRGFASMYRLLMAQREAMLTELLPMFARDEVRVIVCSTQTYYQLLFESYHPDLLRDTLERDRFFDHLWRRVKAQPHLKQFVKAERADLHNGDIPFFTTRPDTRSIYTSQRACLTDLLEEPSLEATKRRVRQLSEEDLTRQLWFIQASFAATSRGNRHSSQSASQPASIKTQVTREQLIQAACAVGDSLSERALLDEYGAHWLGLTFINEREWTILPAGMDLYDGVAGIALFLAYLGAATSHPRYTQLARYALASTREHVKVRIGKLQMVGAFNGWGGIIYLYTHLGILWQDPALLKEAEELVRLLPDLIDQDQELDIIGGSAGCIACLLSLYRVFPSEQILTTALRCGDQILKNAPYCSRNQEKPASSPPLTGFSHGAAGIACSLLKLAAVSGQSRFTAGAIAAMEYERSVFSPQQQNWPDYRPLASQGDIPDDEYMVTWCHGAPGIGLGRLASLRYIDDAAIRQEIAAALQTTLKSGFGFNHSLCHGTLGNIEPLCYAARVLDDPQYYRHVEERTAMILSSIEQHGWRCGIPSGLETPGLMSGIAGIGYALLRLAVPEQIPCLLTLEEPLSGLI